MTQFKIADFCVMRTRRNDRGERPRFHCPDPARRGWSTLGLNNLSPFG